jgi:hypothetical protein
MRLYLHKDITTITVGLLAEERGYYSNSGILVETSRIQLANSSSLARLPRRTAR